MDELFLEKFERSADVTLHYFDRYSELFGYLSVLHAVETAHREYLARSLGQFAERLFNLSFQLMVEQFLVGIAQEVGVVKSFGMVVKIEVLQVFAVLERLVAQVVEAFVRSEEHTSELQSRQYLV